ncbi:MAG: hypothetical protein AB8B56_09085 [Crocinitomicaceae bacterium]
MIKTITITILSIAAATCYGSNEDTVRKYIAYTYGNTEVDMSDICHEHPDNWMIQGNEKKEVEPLIQNLKISITDPGIFTTVLGRDLIFTEIRNGKIDTTFNREGIYTIHKQLILMFLYHSLLQDEEQIKGLVTDVSNISFGSFPKAGYGDMDVYAGILNNLPIHRTSDPLSDSKTQTITYRLPLGKNGFELTLLKLENTWKIDSHEKIETPMEFFWR